jgi:hypothetical protein
MFLLDECSVRFAFYEASIPLGRLGNQGLIEDFLAIESKRWIEQGESWAVRKQELRNEQW